MKLRDRDLEGLHEGLHIARSKLEMSRPRLRLTICECSTFSSRDKASVV